MTAPEAPVHFDSSEANAWEQGHEAGQIAKLDSIAANLYAAEEGWRTFAKVFTLEELEALAQLCQMNRDGSGGRSYDDEVFDALAMRHTIQ